MKRVAVSSSTCVNSSSNWSITSSSWSWSSGRTRWTARRTPPGASSRSSNAVGGVGRDADERRLELLERVRRRCHLDAEPVRRHRQRALGQRRQQPGPHHARLAAPARPDDGHEASPGAGLAEAGDEPLDEAFAPEEVAGVGGAERPQPLVRVLDRGVVEQRRARGRRARRSSARPNVAASAYRRAGSVAVARSSTARTAGGSAPRTCSYSPAMPGERRRRDDRQAVHVRRRRHRPTGELLGRRVGDGRRRVGTGGAARRHRRERPHRSRSGRRCRRGRSGCSPASRRGGRRRCDGPTAGRWRAGRTRSRRDRPATPRRRATSARLPVADQAHHEVGGTGLAPVVVQRDDVRVLEPGDELGLGLEPADERRVVGELGRDHLDRHLAPDDRLVGADRPRRTRRGRARRAARSRAPSGPIADASGPTSVSRSTSRSPSSTRICCSRSRTARDGSTPISATSRWRNEEHGAQRLGGAAAPVQRQHQRRRRSARAAGADGRGSAARRRARGTARAAGRRRSGSRSPPGAAPRAGRSRSAPTTRRRTPRRRDRATVASPARSASDAPAGSVSARTRASATRPLEPTDIGVVAVDRQHVARRRGSAGSCPPTASPGRAPAPPAGRTRTPTASSACRSRPPRPTARRGCDPSTAPSRRSPAAARAAPAGGTRPARPAHRPARPPAGRAVGSRCPSLASPQSERTRRRQAPDRTIAQRP